MVAGLASTAFAGAPEADAFAPNANAGYMVASYLSDDPATQNGAAGAGGTWGSLLGARAGTWLGFKIGAKVGAAIGGPVGAVVGAGLGAA